LKPAHWLALSAALLLGVLLWRAPRTPEVEKIPTEAPAVNPLDSLVAEAVRRIETQEGSPMEAIGMLRQVLETDPEHPGANFYLGMFSITTGQYDKAIERLQVVVKVDPNNPEAHKMLGTAYRETGRLTEARDAFENYRKAATTPAQQAEAAELLKTLN
jgi:cytochrome c-type biogenesis protein CcmH/NrfG